MRLLSWTALAATFPCFLPGSLMGQERGAPADVIIQLYRDFAWEAAGDGLPSTDHATLVDSPREILAEYFGDELVALLLADRACREEGYICSLDGSPIWDSNDPAASDPQISVGADSTEVVVAFRYPRTGQVRSLRFEMALTSSGWRIADIIYVNGRSLLNILRGGS